MLTSVLLRVVLCFVAVLVCVRAFIYLFSLSCHSNREHLKDLEAVWTCLFPGACARVNVVRVEREGCRIEDADFGKKLPALRWKTSPIARTELCIASASVAT